MPATRSWRHEGGGRRRAVRPLRGRRWGSQFGELARWLSGLGVATRTGKPRWGPLHRLGHAAQTPPTPGGPASARRCAPIRPPDSTAPPALAGARHTPPPLQRSPTEAAKTGCRSRCRRWSPRTPGSGSSGDWPDNKRYAARNSSKSLPAARHLRLQQLRLTPTTRTSTRNHPTRRSTTYRCLGSDDYRYEHGPSLHQQAGGAPTTSTTVVWDHHHPPCSPTPP